MEFLPKGYEVPQASGNYMKLQAGANKFRILASPIIGWEGWKDKKPVHRSNDDQMFTADEMAEFERGEVKHFWAMPVWNFAENRVQILEITQKGILKEIVKLATSEDWGSPLEYNLTVTKKGEGITTEYGVIPAPPKPLDKVIVDEWKRVSPNLTLEALFKGDDPFKPLPSTPEHQDSENQGSDDEEINIDDVEF